MGFFSTVGSYLYKYCHYAICLTVFFLVITSVGNFQVFVTKQSLSQWDADSSVFIRFLWDLLLLVGFIVQHSLMATGWFKEKLEGWLQVSVSERLIYVAASSSYLLFLIVYWQSIPETFLWFVDTRQRFLLWLFFFLIHLVCWFAFGLELLLMDVGELLGVSQVYRYQNNLRHPLLDKAKKLRQIYSRMRHPGAVLLTLMLWIHPLMTLDRLLLTCVLTSYMIGRHSFDESHYKFAQKYFTVEWTERHTRSSSKYQYVQED